MVHAPDRGAPPSRLIQEIEEKISYASRLYRFFPAMAPESDDPEDIFFGSARRRPGAARLALGLGNALDGSEDSAQTSRESAGDQVRAVIQEANHGSSRPRER